MTRYTTAPGQASDFEWADRRQVLVDKLLVLAQEKVPGLKRHIVEMKIFTPEDF